MRLLGARLACPTGFGAVCPAFLKSFQQLAGRLVVRILRNQLSTECLGQQGRGELLNGCLRLGQPFFQAISEGEELLYSAYDFGLFFHGWDPNGYLAEYGEVNILLSGSRRQSLNILFNYVNGVLDKFGDAGGFVC